MKPLALLLALTFSACQIFGPDGSASGHVALEASFDEANTQVTVRLINRSPAPIGYALCTTPIEHLETGMRYLDPHIRCSGERFSLAPGAEVEGGNRFESRSLIPGAYQAVTQVEVNGQIRDVRSNRFDVR